jgi:hypothetical protein
MRHAFRAATDRSASRHTVLQPCPNLRGTIDKNVAWRVYLELPGTTQGLLSFWGPHLLHAAMYCVHKTMYGTTALVVLTLDSIRQSRTKSLSLRNKDAR